jgi:threonine/homoserine/homoserine lactone efflux protein
MSEMFGIDSYWLFVTTGVLLNLIPGQDSMFIIGRSLTGGRRVRGSGRATRVVFSLTLVGAHTEGRRLP